MQSSPRKIKLIVSGGHLTPALALCDYLLSTQPTVEIVFVGRQYSQDINRQKAWEESEVTKRGIRFIPFQAVRFSQTSRVWQKITASLAFPQSVFMALGIMITVRPHVFVSFGGYLAIPLAIAAWVCRIPIVTHEQTRAAGHANQLIAKFAKKVAVSFPSTNDFPKDKVVVTGNPLRKELLEKKQPTPDWIPNTIKKPILYVTGGNQGSSVLNTQVAQLLSTLTRQWLVIHQCGAKHDQSDTLHELEKKKESLGATQRASYQIREWVTESELAWIYQHAQVVVSRAGANTVSELAVLRVPSILVPLPFAHLDEQTKNAEWLSSVGGAVLLSQKNLSSESLLSALTRVKNHRSEMKAALGELDIELHGAEKLWHVIHSLI